MADTSNPVSGSETIISLTLDGVPLLVNLQVDSVSEEQIVNEMEHKPLGTSTVFVSQDFNGWRGRIALKSANALMANALDVIEASARLGLPSYVTFMMIRRFRDLSVETRIYTNVKLSQSGGTRQRGQMDSADIAWRTGEQRIAA